MMLDPFELDSETEERLMWVVEQLRLDVTGLTTAGIVDAILAVPEGERLLVEADHTLSRGLRLLFDGLAREGGFIDRGVGWIEFLARDAHIVASVKGGFDDGGVLTVEAHLLNEAGEPPSASEVQAWVAHQPQPVLGVLSAGGIEREDGGIDTLPLLSVDLLMDGVMSEFLTELIAPYADAWVRRSVATGTEALTFGPDGEPYRVRASVEIEPKNAWLLMASEAGYLTPERIAESRQAERGGIYDTMWTAPKNGEIGDLVLIYYPAPRKAAHFVARLASRPFWRTDLAVAEDRPVGLHQWWAWITPPIEVVPIPYSDLRAATGGFLPLKGRSGHYLSGDAVSRLTFQAVGPERQPELGQVAKTPVGMAELPTPDTTSFDEWRRIPSGLLPLEAKVSEHIVAPLRHLLWDAPYASRDHPLEDLTLGPHFMPEHRVASGYVDFVVAHGGPPKPALAIEVKLSAVLPQSGLWADSADFQQLTRYMADLGTPGVLVDAQRILLVRFGESAPFAEIVRAEATWEDIGMIRDLLIEGWSQGRSRVSEVGRPSLGGRRVTRRVARPDGGSPAPNGTEPRDVPPTVSVRDDLEWVSEYRYDDRVASLSLINGPILFGRNHAGVVRSGELSATDETFVVYVTRETEVPSIIKIVAALDDDGGLLNPHPNFLDEFIGSYPLWPYKPHGERLGDLAHWVSWRTGWPFDGEPQRWSS
jgi:hypothetical protein